jgi:hypothetical protein
VPDSGKRCGRLVYQVFGEHGLEDLVCPHERDQLFVRKRKWQDEITCTPEAVRDLERVIDKREIWFVV